MSEVYEASDDTFLLWDVVKEYILKQEMPLTFLDMGAGSGYIGFEALKMGCKVTFADINIHSVGYIKHFVDAEDLGAPVIHSDCFEHVDGAFDVIVFNTPYLPDEPEAHDIALHGGPEGISVAKKFLKQAKSHLTQDGKIFLLASSLGNLEQLELFAQSVGFQGTRKKTMSLFFEELVVYEFVKNDAAFDMKDESQVDEVKKNLPEAFRDAHLLHRGKRGVVFKGQFANSLAACKVLRPGVDARNTIHLEATYLKKANEQGIGPKLFAATDSYVVMEFIEGQTIAKFLQEEQDAAKVRTVLTEIFSQLRKLDTVGLNKFELTNPHKHIIIRDLHPVLIDFERMRHAARPKNVTQFAQYVTSKAILPGLQERGVLVHVDLFQKDIVRYAKGEEVVFEQHL